MKTEILILDINHEDLVELLSTALYGSHFLGCDYQVGDNMETVKFEEEDTCFEDRAARCLLQGKYIEFLDRYAEREDEDEPCGNLPHYWDERENCMAYKVYLQNITDTLSEMFENGDEWAKECVINFTRYEEGDFDQPQAECIIQYILWGEEIYG